jgi:peptidyl-prolyl cis-trans isomerase A (cyclophilin A)
MSDEIALTEEQKEVLLNPKDDKNNQKCPETFKVEFNTSKGNFVFEVNSQWAPKGAKRFYNLVNNGFYNGCRFFRVIAGFMVQFGINGEPDISDVWRDEHLKDDELNGSNKRGFVSYAMAGPNTRTSQLFINFGDNSMLDPQGFFPFAEVVEGMDVVDSLHAEYGEGAPSGNGPNQMRVQSEGNVYLKEEFSDLDYIVEAKVI